MPHDTKTTCFVMALAGSLWVASAQAAQICPAHLGDQVQGFDVFDGKPDDHAILAPDRVQAGWSIFALASVYAAGRSVTIRCKYRSGASLDVELKAKVAQCVAVSDKAGSVSVTCG